VRTRQTARLLFRNAHLTALAGRNEMDFGDFEGRNAYDMRQDAAYRAWVDDNCAGPCPGGESRSLYNRRTEEAFDEAMQQAFLEKRRNAVFVVHGGTIMAIMDRLALPKRSYFDWQISGGECIAATASKKSWPSQPCLTHAKKCVEIPL